jgi:hypothetical protein
MSAAQSLKDLHLSKCWELVKTPKPNEKQGLPAMTWGAMGLRSDQDREGIASVAREMKRELKDAACLF